MSNEQNEENQEAHYAAEEYAVDDYVAPATYTVPQGYYNDDGEFVEVSGGVTEANQQLPQSYTDQSNQYYTDPNQYYYGYNYNTAYEDTSTAPPGTESASTSAATGAPPGTYAYDQYYSQGYYDTSYYTDSAAVPNSATSSALGATGTSAYGNSSSMIPPSDSAASKMSSAAPTPKPYYPPPANSNQPIGPIVLTRSGYTGQDTSASATASPTISSAATEGSEKDNQNSKKKKKKLAVRAAGGEVWEDTTLLDWDENDYRLFAGDLGNEVTEELLFKTFSKYPSLVRTRVVRDKRTMKSKGYGFISFKDPDDFVRAWREMNGKYVGNRPIKLRKSTWRERNLDIKMKKEKERFSPYAKHK